MGVSNELLCSFELLKPLDSSALKSHIKKGRNKRNSMLNSPVSSLGSETPSDVAFDFDFLGDVLLTHLSIPMIWRIQM